MAAWMLYLTVLAAALSAAAVVAEAGARRCGCPTRFIWLATMIGSVVPLALLAAGMPGSPTAAAESGAAESASEAVWSGLLLLGWCGSSIIFLAGVRVSAWTLRRGAMAWRPATIAGEAVLISAETGPAVIGGRHPRYVIPRRVLTWEAKLQRLVLAHEREHVRAGDHRILPFALGIVALAPWCVPLWWQLHRLREAMETDCDERVVATTGAAREYAGVVLSLAGRSRRPPALIPALAPGVREVERRIGRIVRVRRGASSSKVGSVLLPAAVLATGALAAFAAVPDRPYFGLERPLLPPPSPEVVREPPPLLVILGYPLPPAENEGEP